MVENWWIHQAGLVKKREMKAENDNPRHVLRGSRPFPSHLSHAASLNEDTVGERLGKRAGEEESRTINHLACQGGVVQEPKGKTGPAFPKHSVS